MPFQVAATQMIALMPGLREDFVAVAEPSHPDARKLLDYWRARMAEGSFVVGRDIPARPIAKLLRNLAIYEPLPDGSDLRVRLAGDAIRTRFDAIVKGGMLSEFFPAAEFEQHLEGALGVLRSGEPRIIDSRLMRDDVVELHLEVVVLPVTAPDLAGRWVLVGVFYFD